MNTTEEILHAIKNGEMVILVDDEDRENEGDLIIAASHADAKAINFMAMHGRGLICLSLGPAHVERLGLTPMSSQNRTRHETAFLVSIEARDGISTGISAADRARTIQVAIDPSSTRPHIASPGHVFPLAAKKGGVLVRAGHTEAAVDLAILSNLPDAGVICEIMNEDGTMARLPDLKKFALKHGLKLGTIADLIEYRRKIEKLVDCVSTSVYHSPHAGGFEMRVYRAFNSPQEHIALIKNPSSLARGSLARVQILDARRDVLCDRTLGGPDDIFTALNMINAAGSGVLVLLGQSLGSSSVAAAADQALREYGIGAQILKDCGAEDITLLTNNPRAIPALQGYGLTVRGTTPLLKADKREAQA